jgi:hypothetical protein
MKIRIKTHLSIERRQGTDYEILRQETLGNIVNRHAGASRYGERGESLNLASLSEQGY